MGMFRSVIVDYACERCASVSPTEVQFKTDDDFGERYEVGQRIVGDKQLKRGRRFEGTVFRYCGRCFTEYMAEEAEARYSVLATLTEAGRAVLRNKGEAAALTPDQLRTAGVRAREELLSGVRSPWVHEGLSRFDLSWEGQPAVGFNDAYIAFLREYNRRIDETMRDSNWDNGSDWLREDLPVFLDDDFRLRVGP